MINKTTFQFQAGSAIINASALANVNVSLLHTDTTLQVSITDGYGVALVKIDGAKLDITLGQRKEESAKFVYHVLRTIGFNNDKAITSVGLYASGDYTIEDFKNNIAEFFQSPIQ